MAMVESVAESANANGVTMYNDLPGGVERETCPGRPSSGLSDRRRSERSGGARDPRGKAGGRSTTRPGVTAPAPRRSDSHGRGAGLTRSASPHRAAQPGKALAGKVSVRDPRAHRAGAAGRARAHARGSVSEARVLSNLFPARAPVAAERVARLGFRRGREEEDAWRTLRVRVPIGRLVKTRRLAGKAAPSRSLSCRRPPTERSRRSCAKRRPFEILQADAEKAAAGHFTYEVPVVIGSGEARISVGRLGRGRQGRRLLLVERAGTRQARRAAPIIRA